MYLTYLNFFLLAMLSILLFALSFYYYYLWQNWSTPIAELDYPAIPHIAWQCVHVCHFKINWQVKIVIISITSFTARSRFVHSLFGYSLIGILNRSALDFMFVQLKYPRSFLHYAGNFSDYSDIMFYAFQPLLCLKLCQHNWLKPTCGNRFTGNKQKLYHMQQSPW